MAVLLARIVVLLNQVLAAMGVVSGLQQNNTQEHLKYQVESTVVATSLNVASPTYGLSALHDQLTTVDAKLDALALDIADIPTGPQLAGSPVTLPTTPPTGYGVDDGSIAGAVWAYYAGGGTQPAGDLLVDAGWLGINLATAEVRFPYGTSRYFELSGTWWSNAGAPTLGAAPIFPIANILPTDTLSIFLERESFYTGWTANGDGTWQVYADPAHTDYIIYTKITDAEFILLRDGPAAVATSPAAPVWPGVLNVTFGTPVSISTGFTVMETMDGVIVAITGVPPRANFFEFDDKPSYRNLGALSFFTDDNEQETAQSLGFESAIYTPRTMFSAAGVKLRTIGGVSGTVTPWHRTP